jgi:glycosyltransferase involved in cell wall biosynthesis
MPIPTISIIIPSHNRCDLLKETVASVQSQQYPDWELIVVNDCSTDDTQDWLGSLDDERIHAINMERHQERDFCRNQGLKQARGEFVVFLDDDDLLTEWALAEHLKSFEQFPQAIASIGGFKVFDEAGSTRNVRVSRRVLLRETFEDFLFGFKATGGQSLIRKTTLLEIGGWNESYRVATDHELWARLSQQGPIVLRPMVALLYRVHAGQWRFARMR